MRFLQEDATRVAALEAGEIHVVSNVPPDTLERIEGNEQLEVLSVPSVRTVFIAFMTDRPPFDNLELRKAVSYAIDRESIVQDLLGGYGESRNRSMLPAWGTSRRRRRTPMTLRKPRNSSHSPGLNNQVLKFAYPLGIR